jgi:outer membrane protein assembly factor BamB
VIRFNRCFVLGLASVALTLHAVGRQFEPPFRKVWRVQLDGQIAESCVVNGVSYFGTDLGYGALNLATGKAIWQRTAPPGAFGVHVVCDGKTLYALVGHTDLDLSILSGKKPRSKPAPKNNFLIACDARTGKTLWKLPRTGYSYRMALAGRTLYACLAEERLSAIDTRTHKVLWTTDFRRYNKGKATRTTDASARPLRVGDKLFTTTERGGLACLKASTGKVVWHRDFSAGGQDGIEHLAACGHDLVAGSQRGDVLRLSQGSGKTIWRTSLKQTLGGPPIIVGDTVYATRWGASLRAIDAASGATKWDRLLADQRYALVSGPSQIGDRVLVTMSERAFCFDSSGTLLWEWDAGNHIEGQGTLLAGNRWLQATHSDLLLFEHGAPPPMTGDPAKRKAILSAILSHLGRLSRDDERALKALGREAQTALQAALKTARADFMRSGGEKAFSTLSNTAEALALVMDPGDTDAVLELLPTDPRSPQDRHVCNVMIKLLAEKGDHSTAMPIFLQYARKRNQGGKGEELFFKEFRATDSAMSAILESDDPRAVEFLIKLLDDPKANPYERKAAYWSLPAHGGQAGVDAVLRWRSFDRKLKPLADRLGLDTLGTAPKGGERGPMRLLAVHRDADGVLWGLGECAELGSREDLWLLRHDGKAWADAWFTGVTTQIGDPKRPRVEPIPELVDGTPKEKFLKGGWVDKFVGEPALRKDSDADGLTDLAEKRLGTNPNKADSDADGLGDAEDGNPLVAARQLTEDEEVAAAAFEARFKFEESRGPATMTFPTGTRYFEVTGWRGIVVPVHSRKDSALCKFRMQGTTDIGFGDTPAFNEPDKVALVKWVEKGREAVVEVGAMYGFLAGVGYRMTLRRFGDVWLVVKVENTWVS